MNDFEDIIDGIFFGQKVNENAFRKTLNITLSNIAEIRKTPMKQREFEDWE